MHEEAQPLYETYTNYWRRKGVVLDDWQELKQDEKEVWSEMADELASRGWQGI